MIVFLLRPGNLAARYLFLFVAFNQGITLSVQAGLYAAIRPPWLVFLQQLYGWGWVYVFVPAIALIVLVFPIRKWPMMLPTTDTFSLYRSAAADQHCGQRPSVVRPIRDRPETRCCP